MNHCRFCQIAHGEHDAFIIETTDEITAFLDANPIAEGHTVVVPNAHHTGLDTLPVETLHELFTTTQALTHAMDEVLNVDGFSIFHTTGPLIGNIDHAHVHLVPRYKDDDISISLPRDTLDTDTGDHLSSDLADALASLS